MCGVLSRVIKFHTSLHYHAIQSTYSVYSLQLLESLSSCLSYQGDCCGITLIVFKWPLFSLTMATECKTRDTGKLICQGEALKWKSKISLLERNKLYDKIVIMYSKNKSSIYKIVKKEKFMLVILSHLTLQKLLLRCVISA